MSFVSSLFYFLYSKFYFVSRTLLSYKNDQTNNKHQLLLKFNRALVEFNDFLLVTMVTYKSKLKHQSGCYNL